MQRNIYIVPLLLLLTGLVGWVSRSEDMLQGLGIRDNEGNQQLLLTCDTGFTDRLYFVEVDSARTQDYEKEPWFWTVEDSVGKRISESLGDMAPSFKFSIPGKYAVRSWYRMRPIAIDTLTVLQGDRMDVQWPEDIREGEELVAVDLSPNVKTREWLLIQGSDTVKRADDARLAWTADSSGQYRLSLAIRTMSGRVFTESVPVNVAPSEVAPPPVTSVATKPSKVVKPKRSTSRTTPATPRTDPVPETPPTAEPDPAPTPPPRAGACFGKGKRTAAQPKINVGDPTRKSMKWRSAPFTFQVTPKVDCSLASYTYWGNYRAGAVELSIRCMDTSCDGEKQFTIDVITANDEYKRIVQTLSRTPVLRAGLTYEVTLRPAANVDLGVAPVARSSFSNDVVDVRFPANESAVFDLIFKR